MVVAKCNGARCFRCIPTDLRLEPLALSRLGPEQGFHIYAAKRDEIVECLFGVSVKNLILVEVRACCILGVQLAFRKSFPVVSHRQH